MNRSFRVAIAASGILAAAACVQKAATTSAPAAQPQATMAGDTGMRMAGDSGMRRDGRRGMRGADRERMDAMMFEGITLSAAQQAQIDSLRERHRGEMQGMDPRNNPDDRQKMMQMMQARMAEVRALLTPEQQAVFDRNVQQMRDRRMRRDSSGAPPRR